RNRAAIVSRSRVRDAAPGAAQRDGAVSGQQPRPAHPREHHIEPRADGIWGLYNLLSHRRATRARQTLADREGEASTMAVPALKLCSSGEPPRIYHGACVGIRPITPGTISSDSRRFISILEEEL